MMFWKRCGAALVLASIVALVGAGALASAASDAARRGAQWLVSNQQASGAFFSPAENPDETATIVAAIVAADGDGSAVGRALEYVKQSGETSARSSAANAGRIVAGIVAGDANPRSFGGVDYLAILQGFYDGATGSYDGVDLVRDLVAANGVLATGTALQRQAVRYIRGKQCKSGKTLGGFATTDCSSGADVAATAWATNVLRRVGVKTTDPTLVAAKRYFVNVQNSDGGFGPQKGAVTRAAETGLAISALYALHQDPTSRDWRKAGGTPVQRLRALEDPSGGFRADAASSGPDATSTIFAVPGLAARSYPIRPASQEQQLPQGGGKAAGGGSSSGRVTPIRTAVPFGATRENPDNLTSTSTPLQTARPCKECRRAIGSYSKPKSTFDDHVGRTRAIALVWLVVAMTMIGGGVALLRGAKPAS